MPEAILGISAYYHDSAAAIVVDGNIVAAAQEERFSRLKHDSSFPHHAVRYVLDEAGMNLEELSAIVFYEKPFLKFERLLETYHAFAPKGLSSFLSAIPVWIKDKLFMKKMLKDELAKIGKLQCLIFFPEHHLSHAASAFYPSPFAEAAILTIDGVGEWATSTIGFGKEHKITILKEQHFPHSVGLLYSAFTYYTGFTVNSGEYKLMGLAPYGNDRSQQTIDFRNKILTHLVDIKNDGSILLNMSYFGFATGLIMTNNSKWKQLFGIPPRQPESEITQDYMNLAIAIQQVTEDIVLRMAKHAQEITGCKNLVLAGGVALNCVANGKILKTGLFDNIWIQPAAGDAGGALGAALAGWHIGLERSRTPSLPDAMSGSLLGPGYNDKDIQRTVQKFNAKAAHYQHFEELTNETASLLASGKIVGWFQGRMEYGPRALGNRTILGDARNPDMQRKLNLSIKYREGFRPFAPAVSEDKTDEYFDLDRSSPYMLIVANVKNSRCYHNPDSAFHSSLLQRLYNQRSDIPAVTHIDYSARVQTVNAKTNLRFYQLLKAFYCQTGCDVLVNTSFNVRGEPIVCTPDDAYRCFMSTEIDYLVMENYLFRKEEQPEMKGVIKGAKAKD
jgi:carbamoyltransferase